MDMNLCLGTRFMVKLNEVEDVSTCLSSRVHQSHFFQVGSHLGGLDESWDGREMRTRQIMGTTLSGIFWDRSF